ncbi:Atg7p [Rhodotorula paludigena]|uniref:Atg7p n=1 Tax=Rhodotorula paludigena TaxID=86838 RepID=UPI00317CE040
MAAEQPVLQFLPLSTSIAPSFWHTLTSLKLHRLKLDDAPLELTGHYAKGRSVTDKTSGQTVGISGALELDEHSFQLDHVGASDAARTAATDRIRLKGTLRNFNTIEEFKQVDKARLLEELGDQIWHEMTSTASAPTHESLNPFLLVTFADLKKYRYYYWCAFPALVQKPAWEVVEGWKEVDLSEQEKDFDEAVALMDEAGKAIPLEQVRTAWANDVPAQATLLFQDPSSHLSALGWPARNVLSYLSLSPSLSTPVRTLRLVAVRDGATLAAVVRLREGAAEGGRKRPSVVGWEKNDKGKLGPRMADLAPLMDPTRLADQAVDLNLQLMRWRILPSLDLEKVKHTKCLLLGAGTLGCYVARTLMAWGVRKITLVDSSTVSFSNPVRQPLFEFADSLAGGKPKAATAADALKRIYPGVDAMGIELAIPMPGHPIPPTAVDSVRAQLGTLEKLVDEHDVVYLLMDSRESRWLPTVMGAAKGKLVMNVALGFDTFLAMRHGLPPSDSAATTPDSTPAVPGAPYRGQLGCYYCNDIVAPMDSLSDRTLDQMCTVTRPGIASIASSTAVELMVSVLQHPLGACAPSDIAPPGDEPRGDGDKENNSPLGIVPHQIRGFLARFENLKITGQAYDRCTGCSQAILSAYRTDAFDLVQRACEDAKYLERLTGLDKLEEETERMLAEGVEWDDDEEEAGENEDDF